MERTEKIGVVGLTKMGRHRCSRFRKDKGPRVRAGGGRGRSRSDSRRCAIYFARRRTGLALCAKGFAGWAVSDALRAARIARAQSALPSPNKPRGELVPTERKQNGAARR